MKNILRKILKYKKAFLFALALIFLSLALWQLGVFGGGEENQSSQAQSETNKEGASAEMPEVKILGEVVYKDETIPMLWEDDNTGENLIIKSDRKYYDAQGGQTVVFFGVQNTTSKDQQADIYFWFDNADKKIESIKKIGGEERPLKIENCQLNVNCKLKIENSRRKDVKGYKDGWQFQDTTSANQTNYYRAIIKTPANASQSEFFIEAFGVSAGCKDIFGYSADTKNTAISSDVLADFNEVRNSRLGTDFSVASQYYLSSPFVDNSLSEPVEGFAPSKSRIPSLVSHSVTGSDLLYHNQNAPQTKSNNGFKWGADIAYASEQISDGCDKISYGHLDPYLAGGLVGYWSFDGAATNWTSATAGTVTDLSGNSNTGTLTNMSRSTSPVIGISGQALSFDGSDDLVNAGSASELNMTGPQTLSAWVRRDGAGTAYTNYVLIAGKFDGDGGAYGLFYKTSTGDFSAAIRNGGGFYESVFSAGGTGEWHHLVERFDGTNVKLFIDGVEKDSDPAGISGNAYNFNIGGGWYKDSAYQSRFLGLIDEVRVYNRALSQSEITDLYRYDSAKSKVNKPQTNFMNDDSLVGYWSFDGSATNWSSATAGTTNDLSGNNNTGTLTNMSQSATPAIGISGQALSFDGVDDYVDAGSGSSLNDLGPITISAWIYPKSAGEAGTGIIIAKRTDAETSNGDFRFGFNSATARQLVFEKGYSTTILQRFSGWYAYSTNTWQHVVMTWDGSATASNVKFYVNGSEFSYGTTQNGVGTKNSDVGKPLLVGSDIWTQRSFDGLIDEVRVYDRALSASEISDLYRAGAAKMQVNSPTTYSLTDGLVGNWTFNGQDMNWASSTAEALDRSGNNNNGNVTNFGKEAARIGKLGQALNFDGVDDWVNAGSNSSLDDIPVMTVTAWIYPRTKGGNGDGIIVHKSGGFGGDGWSFGLTDFSSSELLLRSAFFSGYLECRSANGVISLNEWQHVAVVWSDTTSASCTASNIQFYRNGVKTGPTGTSASGDDPDDENRNLEIGDSLASRDFDGLIDEVRVYNRALSASEILQLYQAGTRKMQFQGN